MGGPRGAASSRLGTKLTEMANGSSTAHSLNPARIFWPPGLSFPALHSHQ